MVSANIPCRHRVCCDSCKLEDVEATSNSHGHKCQICGMNVDDIYRLPINSQGPPSGCQHAMQVSNQGEFGQDDHVHGNYSQSTNFNQNVAYISSPDTVGDPSWYADNGASGHVAFDLDEEAVKGLA
ncbi:hypothetical protein QYF36_012118 [Acer negundo]|nr:hypothetical protein QYF36_012118 [Acer negundo]